MQFLKDGVQKVGARPMSCLVRNLKTKFLMMKIIKDDKA